MKRLLLAMATFGFVANVVFAQYNGPSSAVQPIPMTVQQLLDSGKDKQFVTLRGTIISHEGSKHYTFADASGKIKVEISPELFPGGQPVNDQTKVQLMGKFEKEMIGKSKLEVKQLTIMP